MKLFRKKKSEAWLEYVPHVVIVAALLVMVLNIVSMASSASVWDDSYMTYRYAHNLLATGGVTWEVGGSHTYGPTSLLFVLPVFLFTFFAQNAALVVLLASVMGGALFLIAVYVLVRRALGLDRQTALFCLAVCFTVLAGASRSLGVLATSGMDTLFSLTYLTLYFALALWVERGTSLKKTSFILGVVGGLAILVRPDFLMFTFLIPFMLAIFSDTPLDRKKGVLALVSTFVVFLLTAFFLWLYFKTPIPLSFFTKSTGMYGPTLARQFMLVPILQLVAFVDAYKLFFLGATVWVALQYRSLFKRKGSAVLKGVAAGAVVYLAYFLFFVIQIMPYAQRFYHPTVPALLLLTVVALAALVEKVRAASTPPFTSRAIAGVCLVLLMTLYTPFFQGAQRLVYAAQKNLFHFDLTERYTDPKLQSVVPCLDVLSQPIEGGSLATTESGFPAVFNIHNRVTDLSGLNDNAIIMQGFSPDRFIRTDAPDVLYVPNHYYKEMREAVETSEAFRTQYEFFSRADLGSFSDVGLRKESSHFEALDACFRERIAQHLPVVDDSSDVYLTLPYPLE